MKKFDSITNNMGRIGYGIGIVVAAGGLFEAIFNKENRMDKMAQRIEELEKSMAELKNIK